MQPSPRASASAESRAAHLARGVYVHVPFCARRCPYCDFAIALPRDAVSADRYLATLALEVERLPPLPRARTVFLGGGTPSRLTPEQLGRLVDTLAQRLMWSGVREFSLEANPEDVDRDRAEAFARFGVTRVSLGVQSFEPRTLRLLGRRHRAEDVARAVSALRAAGICRINLDLIFGAPGHSLAALESDLDRLLSLEPDHVSAYSLTYESGTPFQRAVARGTLAPQEDRAELEQFRRIHARLVGAGFSHYEISNYARPQARCLHNLTYWHNEPHVGVGPSAVSYQGGVRRRNEPDLRRWCELLEAGRSPVVEAETLPPRRALGECVMMGLRLATGVRASRLRRRFGSPLPEIDASAVQRLQDAGLLERHDQRFRLTPRGVELADFAASELL